MFDANKIFLQLNELTTDLIQTGLCDDQNFPYIVKLSEDRKKVCIGDLNTNIFLKNVPYRDVYYEMLKKRGYNFKMLDGAMICKR